MDNVHRYFPEFPVELVDNTPRVLDEEKSALVPELFSERLQTAFLAEEAIEATLQEDGRNLRDSISAYIKDQYGESFEVDELDVEHYDPETGKVKLKGDVAYSGASKGNISYDQISLDRGAYISIKGNVPEDRRDDLEEISEFLGPE